MVIRNAGRALFTLGPWRAHLVEGSTCMYVCMHACMHACMLMCMCVRVCVCVCVYI